MSLSPLENLKEIAKEIRTYYRLNLTKVRYRYMNRISMFTPKNGFPCNGKYINASIGPSGRSQALWKSTGGDMEEACDSRTGSPR